MTVSEPMFARRLAQHRIRPPPERRRAPAQRHLFAHPDDLAATAHAVGLLEHRFRVWLREEYGAVGEEVPELDPVHEACLWDHWLDSAIEDEPDRFEAYFGRGAAFAGCTFFASGCNHPGEIAAFADAGYNVGVAVQEIGLEALAVLRSLTDTGLLVFIDSGAYSEGTIAPEGFTVTDPIADAEWERRLDLFEHLARALGDHLYCVAPDRIADQAVTLERLRAYRNRILRLAAAGANIIVPVHRGPLPMSAFWRAELAALGLPEDRTIAGVPSQVTTITDLRAFRAEARPSRLHLLGISPYAGPPFQARLRSLPDTQVTCDSVRITALVGRDSTPPRPFTAKRDTWLSRGLSPEDATRLKHVSMTSALLEQAAGHESHYETRLRDELLECPETLREP